LQLITLALGSSCPRKRSFKALTRFRFQSSTLISRTVLQFGKDTRVFLPQLAKLPLMSRLQ
jgi:hypothetical protein